MIAIILHYKYIFNLSQLNIHIYFKKRVNIYNNYKIKYKIKI